LVQETGGEEKLKWEKRGVRPEDNLMVKVKKDCAGLMKTKKRAQNRGLRWKKAEETLIPKIGPRANPTEKQGWEPDTRKSP